MNSFLLSEVMTWIEKVPKHNVIGITITGSYARGDFDRHSDVDIVVVTDSESFKNQEEGKFYFKNIFFDVRICNFQSLQKINWSSDMYFSYLQSKIMYDPKGLLLELIKIKKKIWRESVFNSLIISLVRLSVIFEFKDNWKGLKTKTHYSKSLYRGDFVSAHRLLNQGFELVIEVFYLLQNTPTPDYKNKLKMLKKIRFLNQTFFDLITEFLSLSNTKPCDTKRKYLIIHDLINLIKQHKIFKKKFFQKDFYQYYIQNRDLK